MIDIDLRATLLDGERRFELAARFATQARFVALYGPSGAGKTLTLQAIAGLLRPSAGHVRIDGVALYDAQAGIDVPASRRRVGYLFQHYALFPHISVRQNVAFGLTTWRRHRLSPAQNEKVDALLESFGLSAMADSRPGKLSGGQQQRVALARALACEPRVLLLDEPFAALNAMLRADLRAELAETCRQWGIPALMITHDAEDVLALADMAFVYEAGQVVRQVDVRSAESRDLARVALTRQETAPADPLRDKVRALLG